MGRWMVGLCRSLTGPLTKITIFPGPSRTETGAGYAQLSVSVGRLVGLGIIYDWTISDQFGRLHLLPYQGEFSAE
jgi:hypothetical protein